SQYPCFVDIVCQWRLSVHMFAQLHGGQRSYSMGIVGRGNGYRVDIGLFLRQHLPGSVAIGRLFVALARFNSLASVYIAKSNNIHIGTFGKFCQIAFPLSPNADAGYIQLVAGCYISVAQYMPGYNKKSGSRYRSIANKLTA